MRLYNETHYWLIYMFFHKEIIIQPSFFKKQNSNTTTKIRIGYFKELNGLDSFAQTIHVFILYYQIVTCIIFVLSTAINKARLMNCTEI